MDLLDRLRDLWTPGPKLLPEIDSTRWVDIVEKKSCQKIRSEREVRAIWKAKSADFLVCPYKNTKDLNQYIPPSGQYFNNRLHIITVYFFDRNIRSGNSYHSGTPIPRCSDGVWSLCCTFTVRMLRNLSIACILAPPKHYPCAEKVFWRTPNWTIIPRVSATKSP